MRKLTLVPCYLSVSNSQKRHKLATKPLVHLPSFSIIHCSSPTVVIGTNEATLPSGDYPEARNNSTLDRRLKLNFAFQQNPVLGSVSSFAFNR